MRGVILDLCGGTGAWSEPYRAAGFDVRLVTLPAGDVRTYEPPAGPIYGVLAAPPCTEFAASGARWWAAKDPGKLAEALEIVAACLRIIERVRPWFWALENPVGRLARFIGPYRYTWQPWEFGDPETKRTCMWGNHAEPVRRPIAGPYRTRVHRLPPSPDRAMLRSVTPPGFARAFYEANS
jgi:hypothetical protein